MGIPFIFLSVCSSGCALFATRPVQDLANTRSAILAAKEVQADVLAPELYIQAKENYFRAKQEYTLRNFREAKEYLARAREAAEEAEYEAIKKGANRTAIKPPDPLGEAAPINPSAPPPTAAPISSDESSLNPSSQLAPIDTPSETKKESGSLEPPGKTDESESALEPPSEDMKFEEPPTAPAKPSP